MTASPHTDAEIFLFRDEILALIKEQRAIILDKIEKFHAPACTTSEANRDTCLMNFSMAFLALVEQRLDEIMQAELEEEL